MPVTPTAASARLVWVPRAPHLRRRLIAARDEARARRTRAANRRDGGTRSRSDDDTIGDVAANAVGQGCLLGFGEWTVVWLAVVAAAAFAWFLVVPILLFLVDAVVLVLVGGAAIAARVLFRRPWRIEVSRGEQVVGSVSVVGLGNARSRRDEIVAALAAGIDPATLVDRPPTT